MAITIIVLLILAGVTIVTLTGDNGILNQANKAKETTEIGEEKEIIGLSVIQATNVEGYEAQNEKIAGKITEDTTIKILYDNTRKYCYYS